MALERNDFTLLKAKCMSRIIVNGKYLVEPKYRGSGFHSYLKSLIKTWRKSCHNRYHILIPALSGMTVEMVTREYLPPSLVYSSISPSITFHIIPHPNSKFENIFLDPEVIRRYQAQYILFPHLELPDHLPPIPYSVVIHDIIPTLFLTPNFLFKGKTPLKMITRRGITDYFLIKQHLPHIHNLIAISKTTYQCLYNIFGDRVSKITKVIPPGPPIVNNYQLSKPFLKKYGLKSKKYAIYFGGYTFRKNYHFLAKGFTQAMKVKNKRNFTSNFFPLLMVGGKGKIRNSKIILTTPKLPENELHNFISEATFSIYPSLFEGFGLPILESLSLGTLPLLSDIPSSRELISDKIQTLFFNPYRIKSLIKSITYYSNNPYKISSHYDIIKGRINEFSWKVSGEQIDKLFS